MESSIMKKLALLASAAFLAVSVPSMAQLGPDTSVGADTGIGVDMNAGAAADIGAAVSAMSQAEASASEIGSLTEVSAVEVIDVGAQAESDPSVSGAMSENQESIGQLREAIAANDAVLTAIEAQKPGFDVNTVVAANIAADGKLTLFTLG